MADNEKPARSVTAPTLNWLEMLRWAWRQLTSMRTALFLLLLVAVAAVPGSLFPQRQINPSAVTQYIEEQGDFGKFLDAVQMFDVYSSVWFSAIYLLLFISLIGCIVPRIKHHWQAMKAMPPKTPVRFARMPVHRTLTVPLSRGEDEANPTEQVTGLVEESAAYLKKHGYRVEVRPGNSSASVGAERGYLRETGNLLFHISLVGVLFAVAIGGMLGYKGQRILTEGDAFVNTLVGYDSFSPGTSFNSDDLEPYSLTLEKFDSTFDRENENTRGKPVDFTAHVTVKNHPGDTPEEKTIKVNEPLSVGGTDIYIVGNGYAPVVTVRDGDGEVAFSGPVVFLPQDDSYTSLGVIKVPDAKPDQLGLVGFLYPTAVVGDTGASFSAFPELINPILEMNVFEGDVGLDSGKPVSVYALDTQNMKQLSGRGVEGAQPLAISPGQTYDIPGGKGSVTFEGVRKYVSLDVHHDPGQIFVLVFAVLAMVGLAMSLYVPRRRAWVKASVPSGQDQTDTLITVEIALLARGEDFRLDKEADSIEEAVAGFSKPGRGE